LLITLLNGSIAPISPSLASYLIGLVFYVTHFPECCLSPGHASASPIGITPTINDTENKNGKDGQDNNVAQNVRNIVHEQHEQPGKVSALLRWLDLMGGGSHAIWHMFIVLAIYQHKAGMPALKRGFAGSGM
jgi:adiponectin receptor